MKLIVKQNLNELAVAACGQIRAALNRAVAESGAASLLISTGASQLVLLQTLVREQETKPISWDKIDVFHLDEYAGMAPTHPASFCGYIKKRFAELVKPRETHYLYGDRGVAETLERMNRLMEGRVIDLGLIGIGENGHIAFNDPPADFAATDPYLVVRLDDACKRQQVREGWFGGVDEVPDEAFTMSVRQILKCGEILSFVPYAVKAEAVYQTLTREPSNMVPATILKTHPSVTLYLDGESAEKLSPEIIKQYQ